MTFYEFVDAHPIWCLLVILAIGGTIERVAYYAAQAYAIRRRDK